MLSASREGANDALRTGRRRHRKDCSSASTHARAWAVAVGRSWGRGGSAGDGYCRVAGLAAAGSAARADVRVTVRLHVGRGGALAAAGIHAAAAAGSAGGAAAAIGAGAPGGAWSGSRSAERRV